MPERPTPGFIDEFYRELRHRGSEYERRHPPLVSRRRYSAPASRLRVPRRRLALLVPVAVIATGATAAALGIVRPNLNPHDPNAGIGCFDTVSGQASGVVRSPDPNHPDPIAMCRQTWTKFLQDNPQPQYQRIYRPLLAGPLTACVNEAGTMYVFPTSSMNACIQAAEQMGHQPADPMPPNPQPANK